LRALITGVGGFCGAHLVRRLRREPGIEIAGIGLELQPTPQICLDHYFQADVTNEAEVAAAVKGFRPQLLFHLAGVSGDSATASPMYQVNVAGVVHVLEAVRATARDCAVVIVGSAAEYGKVALSGLPVNERTPCKPIGPYGISKYAATLIALDYARRYQMKVSVVRPFNIIGSGMPENLLVGALLARAKQAVISANPVVKIGDMEAKRDFVAASDAVDAYFRLAQSGFCGEIFNICSGRVHSIRHVAKTLLANSPRPIALEFDPVLVPVSPVRSIYGNYKKAARAIGFRPSISLKAALRDVWNSEMESSQRGCADVGHDKTLVISGTARKAKLAGT
jgi:GDP-4-dehydro-6-deoxy-D-mannose reductase